MIDLAKKLALCLDINDFETAEDIIDENCIYKSGEKTYLGPEQILKSYKENSEQAHQIFDEIYYRSSITPIDENKFEMTYYDDLIKKNHKHTYVCKQIVTFNQNGKVEMIEHCEIPEQLSLLNLYYEAIGLKKNS